MSDIYTGSFLKEAIARMQDPNYKPGGSKSYKCNLCNDKGYIATTLSGEKKKLTDVLSSQIDYVLPCKCQLEKQMYSKMKYSNIELDQYEKKSFETFKRDTEEADKMYELAYKFLESDAQGVGFFGKSGTGKTHICTAICNELAKRGVQHRYFNYRTDIQRLKALVYKHEDYNALINDFKMATVLYIDDLFKLSKNSNGEMNIQEMQIVFDIINSRYMNKKRIIVSSEYTVAEMKQFDEATAGRIREMIDDLGMKVEGVNRRFKQLRIKTA